MKKLLSAFANAANLLRKFISNYSVYIAGLSFLTGTFFLIYFAVDDSFIYLRYAKNFKEYGIWNWNPTALDPVEAYTGALYAFLPIIPMFLNIPPQLFLDFIALLTLAALIYRIIREADDKFVRSYLLLLLLLVPTTYIHFYSGLETPVFMLLTFEIFRIFYKIWHNKLQENHYNYFYFLALAITLTRSDGAIIVAILLLSLLLKTRKIINIKSLLSWGAVGIIYFLWRYNYFGHLLPAPAYHKLIKGSLDVFANFNSAALYIIPLILFLPLWIKRRDYAALIISVTAGVLCLMYIYSKLEMNYSDRFFYQISIPTILFLTSKIKFSELRYKNIITICAILFLFKMVERGFSGIKYAQSYTYSLYNSYAKIGKALSQFKGYSLMTGDCGILPYESGWYVYDAMGLANMYVAQNGISPDFLKKSSPDMFILYSSSDGWPSKEQFLIDGVRMQTIMDYIVESGEYNYISSFTSGNYYNAIFIKKNLPDYKKMESEIRKESLYTKEIFGDENAFQIQKIIAFIISGKWLRL